jgi:hypothetical protein
VLFVHTDQTVRYFLFCDNVVHGGVNTDNSGDGGDNHGIKFVMVVVAVMILNLLW